MRGQNGRRNARFGGSISAVRRRVKRCLLSPSGATRGRWTGLGKGAGWGSSAVMRAFCRRVRGSVRGPQNEEARYVARRSGLGQRARATFDSSGGVALPDDALEISVIDPGQPLPASPVLSSQKTTTPIRGHACPSRERNPEEGAHACCRLSAGVVALVGLR